MEPTFASSPASTHADAPTPTPNGGWYRAHQLGQGQGQYSTAGPSAFYHPQTGQWQSDQQPNGPSRRVVSAAPSSDSVSTPTPAPTALGPAQAHSGRTQTTPPSVYFQGIHQSPSSASASTDSDPRPSNHTTNHNTTSSSQRQQQRQVPLFRSASTYSTTSVPPALSNGPSPVGASEEVVTDVEMFDGYQKVNVPAHAGQRISRMAGSASGSVMADNSSSPEMALSARTASTQKDE